MKYLERVDRYLRNVVHCQGPDEEGDKQIRAILTRIKAQAVECDDQEKAKLVWCKEQILEIQSSYLAAFRTMKEGSFCKAWCLLERVEIELDSVARHFEPDDDEYQLKFIGKHTNQFQSLFPYRAFFSPALLHLEKVCSICGQPISIRNPCGHRKGEIYNGEMCLHIVKQAELLEISIVTKPVQKYSVAFMVDPETDQRRDHYNYSLVQYVIDGLHDPFHAWDMHWTMRRHPHSRYEHVGRNEDCPCGSGKQYKDCCLRESGVLQPHLDILFSVPPPDHLPKVKYID